MKKVRTEDRVMANATDYFKRRNLELVGSGGATSTTEQHAGVLGLVSPSTPNTFTFSTTSTQHALIDHQYLRLKSWMMEASEPCRSELSQVLFPLFVHLYLELVTGAGRQAANKFFKRHYQVFLVNRDYEHTLSQVIGASGINAAGDVNASPVIQNLKSGKYLVRLSELTLNYFLKYLKSSENPTLLQIFNTYIEVEVDEAGGGGAVFRNADASALDSANHLMNDHTPDSLSSETAAMADGMDCTVDELRKVKEVMAAIRTTLPTPPSLCVYTVFNAYNGISSATVNKEGRMLSCGFEDSVIKMWKLTAPSQSGGLGKVSKSGLGPRGGISHTLLACDHSRTEEDSEDLIREDRKDEDDFTSDFQNGGRRRNYGGELFALRGHSGPVYDTAFTHESKHLLSVSEDCTMRLWDLESGQAVVLYRGHHYPVWCLAVAPLTMYVATGSYDTTARLWSMDTTHPLRTLAGHTRSVDSLAFHANGSYLASGSADRSIRLWQTTDGSAVRILLHHKTAINSLAFSPDGKYLASGGEDGTVAVWDLAASRVLTELYGERQGSSGILGTPTPHMDSVVDLSWSTDSSLLMSASSDGVVRTSQFREGPTSEGGSHWDLHLREVGQFQCCNANDTGVTNGSGGLLLHTSFTCHNYLNAVVAQDVER